jgi:hypothetical protein
MQEIFTIQWEARTDDAAKIKRVLLLIQFMQHERTAKECALFLGCHIRTAYRYFRLFKSIGYTVIRDKKTVTYKLATQFPTRV